jgi:hypothetical protein
MDTIREARATGSLLCGVGCAEARVVAGDEATSQPTVTANAVNAANGRIVDASQNAEIERCASTAGV